MKTTPGLPADPEHGLQQGFKPCYPILHSVNQGKCLMFSNRGKGKVVQTIVGFDSIQMMNYMPLGDGAIVIHPYLDMLPDIAIGPSSGMFGGIQHNIAPAIQITATLPAGMVGTTPSFARTGVAKLCCKRLRLSTNGAKVPTPEGLKATLPTLLAAFMHRPSALWAEGFPISQMTAYRAKMMQRGGRYKLSATSATIVNRAVSAHRIPPIGCVTTIIAQPTINNKEVNSWSK